MAAPKSNQKTPLQYYADDDDFQDADGPLPPLTQRSRCNTIIITPPLKNPSSSSGSQKRPTQPLIPSSNLGFTGPGRRPSKRPKASISASCPPSKSGTPHFQPSPSADSTAQRAFPSEEDSHCQVHGFKSIILDDCSLDSIESTIDCSYRVLSGCRNPHPDSTIARDSAFAVILEEKGLNLNQRGGYSSNSLESKLLTSIVNPASYDSGNNGSLDNVNKSDEFEPCTQFDVLLKLCSEENEQHGDSNGIDSAHHQENGFNNNPIHCPLCGTDISDLTDELRQVHTNDCLDKEETLNLGCPNDDVQPQCRGQVVDGSPIKSPRQIADISPVLEWLRCLGLARYEEIFVQEEIDWDTLQWLTEEDLFSIGVTALGPRKKIVHALSELRKERTKTAEKRINASRDVIDETNKVPTNKLITEYFPGSVGHRKKDCASSSGRREIEKRHLDAGRKHIVVKKNAMNEKLRKLPQWCCVSGTPFRVDAFKYLRRDCSHWFLTHFHIDHYQGLTRSFSHGKIYCSLITARLVNMKIGIPWDKLLVLPLNQKISIAGIDVTCFDANHCPGSIILLFEPPNGKAVLHTGDFRFCEEMANIPVLQMCCVRTLILDTTYCNPQYDFPKQEAVIQFVIEAIQAEAFNPKTLFLIGSYTIGKERLFLEVARVLRKKVYVTAAKLRLLECLGLSMEDMQWFTLNERESHIHVVPMWTLASFKRLKCISNQYAHQFSLIVAFAPSGWTFGKGKKSSGRRWQQGTIVRYEVPYSEHCSFSELREFVKFISPENIIPSVNNDGPESANAMISHLLS